MKPIGEFQRSYGDYERLCQSFKEVNQFFSTSGASVYIIDIEKMGGARRA
ncbi:hypothetical protein [Neobacillus bataviensis]|nr:hypothetical protein [Neobacillus bataviensis]